MGFTEFKKIESFRSFIVRITKMKTIEIMNWEDRNLWAMRNIELEKHSSYLVKNVYFKEKRMDEWNTKKQEIIERYNLLLQERNKETKARRAEEEARRAEEEARRAEEAEKEEMEKAVKRAEVAAKRAATRKANKAAAANITPRRSGRVRKPIHMVV